MEPRLSIITLGVQDLQRSYEFYHRGLGFPTSFEPEAGIVFFKTSGVCLALYPIAALAKDVADDMQPAPGVFSGITIAHNVADEVAVDAVIGQAEQAGADIKKPPCKTNWGGYSGYFADPDGYLWEVACGAFEFNADGSLIIP